MAAVLVRPGLYVGGQARAAVTPCSRRSFADSAHARGKQESLAALAALGVTRVISLGVPPAATPLVPPACLRVQLADEEEADLLSQLPACVAFAADAARDGATLLVACHAGAWSQLSRPASAATR